MLVSHSPPCRTWGPLLLLLATAGCAEWPRYANIDEPQETIASDVDLRTRLGLTWQSTPEAGDNDLPTSAQSATGGIGKATLIDGRLDGVGWYDQATPRQAVSEDCQSAGSRSPSDEGDYIGDVDFFVLTPDVDATLCARALLDLGTYGWDLLLFELDACNVPTGVVLDDAGEILGYGGGGPSGEWAHLVTAGTRYGVLLAGYFPNELDTSIDYTLGLSIVASRSDGSVGLCPLLPGEGGEG